MIRRCTGASLCSTGSTRRPTRLPLVEHSSISPGQAGIDVVEISTDDGETWQTAEIGANPNPDGIAWVLWTHEWDATPGAYTLVVRAIDGTGEVQTSEEAPELPDGSSGWHRITVGVV